MIDLTKTTEIEYFVGEMPKILQEPFEIHLEEDDKKYIESALQTAELGIKLLELNACSSEKCIEGTVLNLISDTFDTVHQMLGVVFHHRMVNIHGEDWEEKGIKVPEYYDQAPYVVVWALNQISKEYIQPFFLGSSMCFMRNSIDQEELNEFLTNTGLVGKESKEPMN